METEQGQKWKYASDNRDEATVTFLSTLRLLPYKTVPTETKTNKCLFSIKRETGKQKENAFTKQSFIPPFMAIHRENEDEIEESERESLIVSNAKVIEYLEPSMSIELLCKFPDNSACDFDYSQSTIWSPLAPRPFSPLDLDLMTPRNLSYDEIGLDLRFGAKSSVKKVGSRLRKKFAITALNLNLDLFKGKKMKKNKKKMMASDLSPTPPRIKRTCNPTITKGWAKLLKAASKQFKRRKMKKESTAHVILPKSL